MKISARNVFEGKISALTQGAVNAELEITTAAGDRIVAIVTEASVRSLDLAVGKVALAFVKAPWVIVMAGDAGVRFSARNQLAGTVDQVTPGAVNSSVTIKLKSGARVHAVVTNDAVADLGLVPGAAAIAMIKASHVVVGVPA